MAFLTLRRPKTTIVFLAILSLLAVCFGDTNLTDGEQGRLISPSLSSCRPFIPMDTTWRKVPLRHPVTGPLHQLPRSKPSNFSRIQHQSPDEDIDEIQLERRDAVKQTFLRSWASYKREAWLRDELRPFSGYPKNNYGGWGVTLVDALDTLW